MSYIGQAPFQEFTSTPTKDSFTGDGSTTTFDLAQEVASAGENALEVFINHVRQEPGTGKSFTLGNDASGDNKRITFASAPASSAAIYVINDKTNLTAIAPTNTDMNGVELILDADADASITADTDDRIDFKIANVEHFSFSNSSGDTIIKPMTDAKDIKFQQYDGRTLLDINDGGYVAIANGATGPGQLRLYEDTDLGTNYTAFQVGTQSGDVTYTLPTADGTDGYQLTTDGSGTLSWAGAGAALTGSTNNTITTVTAANAFQGEANLTFDGSTLAVTGAATVSTTLTATGVVTAAGFTIGSAVIGEAELEILDGANVTTTELNLIDGGTARGTDALASGDGILINDAGTMKMTNVDTVQTFMQSGIVGKQTIYVPAAAITPTSSNGCATRTQVETTAGRPDMDVLDFDDGSDEHAQYSVAFPKSWNLGTVTFQAFWTSTATDTDGVAWGLQGVAVSNDGTIDVVYGTAVVVTDDNISAAEDLLVTSESSAITIAGTPADDDICYFRVFRDVSDGNDDMAEDARLIGIKLFFTTDALNDA